MWPATTRKCAFHVARYDSDVAWFSFTERGRQLECLLCAADSDCSVTASARKSWATAVLHVLYRY
jgi:hypothetical protein